MFRFLAKVCAKLAYRFKLEKEAATNDLNAGLSARLAREKRKFVEQLNKEADVMETRIKQVAEMEEKGFWLCENGHEQEDAEPDGLAKLSIDCDKCDAQSKYIKRSEMSGQEKYESDKERGETEKIVQSKRDQAKDETKNMDGSEAAAKYFRNQAANSRATADKVRAL